MPNLNIRLPFAAALAMTVLLSACTTLSPDYEEPTVTINSFRALPNDGGMIPSFEIGLSILNPNAQALNIEGIVYTVSLQGHDLVKGVGKDFPVIEGYSEGQVKLTATANLFSGIRLFSDMMKNPADELDYEFEAKLDMGGLWPSVRVKETGAVDLAGNAGRAHSPD